MRTGNRRQHSLLTFSLVLVSAVAPSAWAHEPGRMTGGGSIFCTAGGETFRVTHGFELHCAFPEGAAPATPNNLEINWQGGNNFHLPALTSAVCVDSPEIGPAPPQAGFDTLFGEGTGLLNGTPASISFTITDAGEPGTSDALQVLISQGGSVRLQCTGLLDRGNHQAHRLTGKDAR